MARFLTPTDNYGRHKQLVWQRFGGGHEHRYGHDLVLLRPESDGTGTTSGGRSADRARNGLNCI